MRAPHPYTEGTGDRAVPKTNRHGIGNSMKSALLENLPESNFRTKHSEYAFDQSARLVDRVLEMQDWTSSDMYQLPA